MVYGAEVDTEWSWPLLRLRMWEAGHSLEEIDALGMEDLGQIIAYWSGKAKGDETVSSRNRRYTGGGSK